MERLYKGIRKFQTGHFRQEENFYAELAKGQSPDALFFTCSDSRVDPNIITQSKPGDLFIVKNVGNIIPICNDHYKKTCTAAAIEFSLKMLNIETIVVCGHSSCGAVKAMFKEDKEFHEMDNLKEWVDTGIIAKQRALENSECLTHEEIISAAEKEHIKTQLEHLKTYPLIQEALAAGKITLQGWHYDIGTGEVYKYDESTDSFEKITCSDDVNVECDPFEEPCGDLS